MGENSAIAWTDHTFNAWWGCTRVSPGCTNCYAETLATTRFQLRVWGVDANRKAMSENYWREPVKWNKRAAAAQALNPDAHRPRVFCSSMADVFELLPERNVDAANVQRKARDRLWKLIEATPALDWLLLTKRPENVDALVPWGHGTAKPVWPRNVWLGCTVEDEERTARIDILRDIPARMRFISFEPALERVDFAGKLQGIGWLIIGGESGSNARPFDVMWAREALDAARAQDVAPFVKQLGQNPHDSRRSMVGGWSPGDPEPDTRLVLASKKGVEISEWPEDLRVQEFPPPDFLTDHFP